MNRMQAWPSGRRHQIANLAGHPHRRFESARLLQWEAQAQRRVRRTCKPSGLLCKLFGWPRPVAPARRPWNVIHLDYGGGSGGTTTVCYTTSSYFTRTVTTAMNSSHERGLVQRVERWHGHDELDHESVQRRHGRDVADLDRDEPHLHGIRHRSGVLPRDP
jgi:hypothetical protein